jgi:hypothetical protein
MSFELIKDYYNLGLFTNDNLDMFVFIGWLTEEQSKELKNESQA